MKLRRKLNIAGFLCFFIGVFTAFLASAQKRSTDTELFKLFAALFILAATISTITGFIMKKMRRRKKRKYRTHSRENRTVMTPYTETEGYGEILSEKAEEECVTESEPQPEIEHVYQIYTMDPKKPKGKKRKRKKKESESSTDKK